MLTFIFISVWSGGVGNAIVVLVIVVVLLVLLLVAALPMPS